MKKAISILLALVMVMSIITLIPITVSAETSGDYEYKVLDDGTAKITDYTGSGGAITIPSSLDGHTVTSIGLWAFAGCSSLTSVNIPDSVTNIDSAAFRSCVGLTEVNIPDSVTSIGEGAFELCSSLTEVTIGNSVTSIGNNAFFNCSSLTKVNISNSVTNIGNNAFQDCSGLTEVTIPDSVTSIGYYAFGRCSSLTEVTIGNSVTSIGAYAFESCSSLTEVTIPDSVTSIGLVVFNICSSLKNIAVGNNNRYYSSIDGNLYDKFADTLIQYAIGKTEASFAIPDSVTSIGYAAFNGCSSLTSVTIPGSVTNIDSAAFRSCVGLTKVTIPDSVTTIGESAFDGCSSLTEVTIGNSVTSISYAAFYGCSSLTEVNIPDSVTSIGIDAFCDCSSLTKVTIPDSVTCIDYYAFARCRSLTEVTIPDSVTSIVSSAFNNCTRLKDVYYAGSEEDWNRMSIGSDNESLTQATIHFNSTGPVKGGYISNYPHYYNRFYDFTDSDDIWTAPHKDGTVPVEMDLGLYQDEGKLTKMDIKWSYSMFGKSSHIADNDLAIASLVLSANAYVRERQRNTLQDLGFSDINFYNTGVYDDPNRVENVIASTSQLINGKWTDVIVIACRGSDNLQDWYSNIDSHIFGFRYAAEDIKDDLMDYIKNKGIKTSDSSPTKILITGHSRGAAAANNLATMIPSDIAEKSDIFTYTFACPNTTKKDGRENYPIFNILNSGDPVTQVPVIAASCPRFGAHNIWFDKATAKDFDSYFTAITGLNDVTYILDYPLAWCNGTFGLPISYAFRHHSLALYLAFLLGEGVEYNNSPNFNKKRISIECPVDVSVYDSAGQLLGSIKDNVADDALLTNGIVPVIDGDKKYLYITSNRDISLKLTGSDSGQMKYTVQDIDLNSGEVSEQGEFSSVALENGKTMTSAVAYDIDVKDTKLYVADGDNVLKKVSDNGEESDVVMISFDTGAGEKIRDMAVKKGEAPGELPEATLEGYGFDGWYRDKECTEAFDETKALNEPITLYAAFYQSQTAYAGFTNMSYDGSKLEAEVTFDYNHLNGQLVAVLYKDDKMLACSFTTVTDSDSTANISLGVTGLSGLYELKLFCENNKGQFEPAGKTAGYDISFYSEYLYSGNNLRRVTADDKVPTLVKNGNVILPESLNVNGQTFDGWYSDEAFMTKFDFDAADVIDTTLYAKWNMYLLGDVDGDGEVSIIDASFIQQYDVGISIPISEEDILLYGDVDNDGNVGILDATLILRYNVGLTIPYPIGEPIS